MPAVFKPRNFLFEEGEEAPQHTDDYPRTEDIDPNLRHIEGLIPEDGDYVWLAINLDDPQTAERMLAAAIRRQRAEGEAPFGIAAVGPDFEGVFSAGYNILPGREELVIPED